MVGFEAHLRFTSFECSNLIFMLTDGVMPFAFESDQRTLRPRFLQPIDAYLAANRNAAGAEALRQTLDGGDVRASDGDDKTLIWARCSA